MELVLEEPKLLSESIGIISELVNEGTFKITKDMIQLNALDPANVAMVDFKILSLAFKKFKVDKEQEITLNMDQFKQVLRRAKPTDTIVLSLDKEGSRFCVTIKGNNTKTFNLSLIDADEKDQKMPNLTFTTKVETQTSLFDEAIEDMGVVSESVSFIIEGKNFLVKAESSLQDAKVEFPSGKETKIESRGSATSKYSIEYLKKMVKGGKLCDEVTVQFAQDYPLKLHYSIKDKLLLGFILAPRVDND